MKKDFPKISVLMPVYNGELYLKEAIESILNQTFKDFEFIIINDGSTDNSKDIIEQYAKQDMRIRVYNQINKGLVYTLNRGLKLAQSNLIARMDADDVALSTRLEKQFTYMEKHPKVIVLGCSMRIIGQHGKHIRTNIYPIGKEFRDRFPNECLIAHSSVMMKKDKILRLGGYNPLYTHAEDYALWLKVFTLDNNALTNLKEPLLLYRQHNTSISFKYRGQQQLASTIAQKAYKFFKTHGYDPSDRLETLTLDHLNLFGLPQQELNEAIIEVMQAKVLTIGYNKSLNAKKEIAELHYKLTKIEGITNDMLAKFFLCMALAYYLLGYYILCFGYIIRAIYCNPGVAISNIRDKLLMKLKALPQ